MEEALPGGRPGGADVDGDGEALLELRSAASIVLAPGPSLDEGGATVRTLVVGFAARADGGASMLLLPLD